MSNKRSNIIIPDEVKAFSDIDYKKFKKKQKKNGYDKKEINKMFNMYLLDYISDVILFIIKYGHIQKEYIQECKTKCYQKITDPDFIKLLKKNIEKGEKIKNIKLLPIILTEVITEAQRLNAEKLKEDPEAEVYDVAKLVDLSETILTKKIKKMTKEGLSKNLAFDLLSTCPDKSIFKITSPVFRLSQFMKTLYAHASNDEQRPDFKKCVNALFNDENKPLLIGFVLLERKERFSQLNDKQKEFYLDVSNWAFDTLENSKKDEIESILEFYIKIRKRDESKGKDGNRRFNLASLPKDDYPRITSVIDKRFDDDKKYL